MKFIPALAVTASLLLTNACLAEQVDFYREAMKGDKMDAAQVTELEASLEAKPDDLASRTKLLGYYFIEGRKEPEKRLKHILWVIKNHASSDLAALPYCHMDGTSDPADYVEAKKLWLEQTDDHPDDAKILGNAAAFFLLSDKDLAEDFLKRAQKAEPENTKWPDNLGHLYLLDDSKEAAVKALIELEKAQAVDVSEKKKFYRLDKLSKAALQADELEKATRYAKEALGAAERFPKDWNHGNAIHHGNNILGLIALRQGDMKLAVDHLLKSGKTPGSPQLNSFGPSMLLAERLLEMGEKAAVLEYFGLCRKFWEMGGPRLDKWTNDMEVGDVPDFGGRRN